MRIRLHSKILFNNMKFELQKHWPRYTRARARSNDLAGRVTGLARALAKNMSVKTIALLEQ
jgi:hypothetical protein